MTARLLFSDTKLANAAELDRNGARTYVEVKFENAINRVTSVANPRQIERVIAGSKFNFDLVYEVALSQQNTKPAPDKAQSELIFPGEDEIQEDFDTIVAGLELLELDYLGGHGSRGYGRVRFHNLAATVPTGELAPGLLQKLNDKLKKLNAEAEGSNDGSPAF
jgi:CRISPR-associated protein Csm3